MTDEADNLSAEGSVAQWLEQTAHNRLVLGSSPSGPTTVLAVSRLRVQTTDFEHHGRAYVVEKEGPQKLLRQRDS